MPIETVLAFSGVAMLAYLTPGPDWFVVMSAAIGSKRRGWVAACGVQCGLLVHMTAAAIGVAAVILVSATAFTVLKWVGAAYLVVLGIRALLSTRSGAPSESGLGENGSPDRARMLQVWRRAFTANILNPKAALFFVAVLPQFLDPSGSIAGQVVALGLLDVALGAVWWALFVIGVHRLRALMGGPRAQKVTDRVAGTALIGLGGVLAATPAKV